MWMISPVALAGLVIKFLGRSIGGVIGFLMGMLMLALCALTLTGRFAPPQWPYDLANHFVAQMAACQALALLITLFRRPSTFLGWIIAALTLGCFALNLIRLAPYAPLPAYWQTPTPAARPVAPSSGPTLSILHLNAQGVRNQRMDLALAYIRERQPDIVALSEFPASWEKAFTDAPELKSWPYRLVGRAQIGVFSKRPLRQVRYDFLNAPTANQTWVQFETKIGSEPVTLVVTHLPIPAIPESFARERAILSRIAAQRERYRPAWLLVGDLNMTPWSCLFQAFLSQSGLRDSQERRGVQASWPVWPFLPAWATPILGVPIDHVLVSDRLAVVARSLTPPVGSDHLGVWVVARPISSPDKIQSTRMGSGVRPSAASRPVHAVNKGSKK